MSEEDKETGSERVKPLEVKPISGVKGTVRVFLDKKNNQK